jgi:hypothetical protein
MLILDIQGCIGIQTNKIILHLTDPDFVNPPPEKKEFYRVFTNLCKTINEMIVEGIKDSGLKLTDPNPIFMFLDGWGAFLGEMQHTALKESKININIFNEHIGSTLPDVQKNLLSQKKECESIKLQIGNVSKTELEADLDESKGVSAAEDSGRRVEAWFLFSELPVAPVAPVVPPRRPVVPPRRSFALPGRSDVSGVASLGSSGDIFASLGGISGHGAATHAPSTGLFGSSLTPAPAPAGWFGHKFAAVHAPAGWFAPAPPPPESFVPESFVAAPAEWFDPTFTPAPAPAEWFDPAPADGSPDCPAGYKPTEYPAPGGETNYCSHSEITNRYIVKRMGMWLVTDNEWGNFFFSLDDNFWYRNQGGVFKKFGKLEQSTLKSLEAESNVANQHSLLKRAYRKLTGPPR